MMRMIPVLILAIIILLTGMIVYSTEGIKINDEALFEKKCSQCHSTDRPKSRKMTAAEWGTTVMRMKNVNGCDITDQEAKIIIDYLTINHGK